MTTEMGGVSPEIKFDKQLFLQLLTSTELAKKVKKGLRIMEMDDEESAFSVAVGPSGNLVFSTQITGETSIYAASLDDYFLSGHRKVSSVYFNKVRFPAIQGLVRIADFHFHPDGITTPSYEDADTLVNRAHTSKIPTHKKLFWGIFAKEPHQLKCLLFGLRDTGLTSTEYQAWDSVKKASGFKQAMIRSGFWISEGIPQMGEGGNLLWEERFIDEVSKNFEK